MQLNSRKTLHASIRNLDSSKIKSILIRAN